MLGKNHLLLLPRIKAIVSSLSNWIIQAQSDRINAVANNNNPDGLCSMGKDER